MALRETNIKIVKQTSPATEEEYRRKAEFDSSMVMVRHHVKYADREAAEYFFRQLTQQTRALSNRYGFKLQE